MAATSAHALDLDMRVLENEFGNGKNDWTRTETTINCIDNGRAMANCPCGIMNEYGL